MAAKKTAAEQGLQQKMKVLAKLFDAGCKTEILRENTSFFTGKSVKTDTE